MTDDGSPQAATPSAEATTVEAPAVAPPAEATTVEAPAVAAPAPEAAAPATEAISLAGDVAIDVARQLAEPLRALRERLGLVVDHLERHVATSTGPAPYPWRSLQSLRQDLGGAYLEATNLARRFDELDRALADSSGEESFDLPAAVELGLQLARHHTAAGIELLIDLGQTPPVRGTAPTIALIVAQLVAASAASARALPGSSVSVRVSSDGPFALVAIADNGAGSSRVAALGELIRRAIVTVGGTIDAASVPGSGCTFELRLPIIAP